MAGPALKKFTIVFVKEGVNKSAMNEWMGRVFTT